jgi:hypothetical protein
MDFFDIFKSKLYTAFLKGFNIFNIKRKLKILS